MLLALRALTRTRCPTCTQQLPGRNLFKALSSAAPRPASHYEVLGLQKSATAEEVKGAFRKRAKDLHPDLKAGFTAADGEAFLRLVSAYEVLSDPQQRKLYDIASDAKLPSALKRAAAAAAAAADEGGSGAEAPAGSNADPFAWRYGMSDWARQGPAGVPAAADDASRLRWSVMSALAKHRRELERDLHAALLKAFLGPQLQVLPGQLPGSFEADERAHPLLSRDLLHLVHGRTLLGVVRAQQPLQIAGGPAEAAALPQAARQGEQASLPPAPLTLPPGSDPAPAAAAAASAAAAHVAQPAQQRGCISLQDRGVLQEHPGHVSPASGAAEHHVQASSQTVPGIAAAADGAVAAVAADDTALSEGIALSEAEWEELLKTTHPLRGAYEWQPQQPPQLPAAAGPAPTAACSSKHASDSTNSCGRSAAGQQGCADACIGGRAANQAWEAAWQLQHAADGAVSLDGRCCAADLAQPNDVKTPAASAAPSVNSTSATMPRSLQTLDCAEHQGQQQDSTRISHVQQDQQPCIQMYQHQHMRAAQQLQQQQQLRRRQHQREPLGIEMYGRTAETCGEQQQQPRVQQQQQQQQQAAAEAARPGSQQHSSWLHQKQRRLMRWLRTPTADWAAADWGFDDACEGVLVLQLVMADGRVAAVSVRDDKQPVKPIKVYIQGVFTAAVLDDVVMEPLTGRLMSVLYKYYTPGVHHLYFYLPGTKGSRVIARLQRRWMPPSSTWLFPPVSDSHDGGGWVVEWEGHEAQHKPGWMHPAVFVLTAGCYSHDMEQRRHAGMGDSAMQEWAAGCGRQLGKALQWLRSKWWQVIFQFGFNA